jgi:hypothetical protein
MRRTVELHADWLRLVEPEGQYLTLPVLRRAFPDGLVAIAHDIRDQLRDRFPQGQSPSKEAWRAWIDWLLGECLAWGPYYRTGEDVAEFAHAIPEQGLILKADGALCDPESGKPRVIVTTYAHGTPLEKRIAGERSNTSPIDRLNLLCRAQGVRVGLVTDGERVVLVWVPSAGTGGYATWETALFTESRERNLLQSFVSLLHASRFFAVRSDAQLEALFEASEKAQNEVTDQLGFQVRQAVELLVAALSRADLERGGELLAGIPPQKVYEAAATVMMRLVFLLYAEERDLLPLSEPLYADYYSAFYLREQLDEQVSLEGDEPLERRGAAWYRLLALFRAIYGGLSHDRLRIPPYGGRLFDPDRFPFLEGRKAGESWLAASSRPLPVDDLTVRAILEAIQTLPVRENGSRERRRLSFRALDVEQIGHVYEGLLDHGAERVGDVYVGLVGKAGDEAEIPLADLEKEAGKGVQPLVSFLHDFTGKSESAIEKLIERGRAVAEGRDSEARRLIKTVCDNNNALAGRVAPFFYTLRRDLHDLPVVFPAQSLVVKPTRARRESGTEYTPRELAEEMVRHALEPLVYSPGPRDGAERDLWRVRPSAELLDLKICDPAVGSGAFLVSACRYLADRVVEAWVLETPEKAKIAPDELTLEARRLVVDRCLYGIDRDHMAVEMAKLSLWLTTMARERPFSFLDHSIREGDSLLGISSVGQLRYLHIDPEAGKTAHSKTNYYNVAALAAPILELASSLRNELETLPTRSVRDSEEKQRLSEEADRAVSTLKILADGIVATAISTASETPAKRDKAFQGYASIASAALEKLAVDGEALEPLRARSEQQINAGRPEGAPPRTVLHWPLVFPEVFGGQKRGFDAIVGNPPFIGGQKITGAFGTDYRNYLVDVLANGRRGTADIVAYFFLRAAELSRSFGFLAVNTIAQGDTREVGLDALLEEGWRIIRASRSRPWPGTAGVYIAQVWLSRGGRDQPVLDDVSVAKISALLLPARRIDGKPFHLLANSGLAFIGSYVLGMGFTLSPEAAAELIEKDRRNAEVLFPYLNTDDLCSRPCGTASRWIINFFDWPLSRAEQFEECLAMVRERVKPERDKNPIAYRRNNWWLYASAAHSLYALLRDLDRAIAMPLTSKVMLPMLLNTGIVFDQTIVVIASDSEALFGVMSSTIHRSWARKYGGTLTTRPRYIQTDCFETFPFPAEEVPIAEYGHELSEYRGELSNSLQLGLTKIYNRVNNPSDAHPEILRLREIHAKLDEAVARAYGWSDLELGHGFHETDEGLRWTVAADARDELLDRLLELNHDRHRAELANGLVNELGLPTNGKHNIRRSRKSASSDDLQLALMDDHG